MWPFLVLVCDSFVLLEVHVNICDVFSCYHSLTADEYMKIGLTLLVYIRYSTQVSTLIPSLMSTIIPMCIGVVSLALPIPMV